MTEDRIRELEEKVKSMEGELEKKANPNKKFKYIQIILIIAAFFMLYVILTGGLATAASMPFPGKDAFLLVAYTVPPCITMGIVYPCLVVFERKKSGNKTVKKEHVPHQFLILQGALIVANLVTFIFVPFMIYFGILLAPMGALGGTLSFYLSYLCYGLIIILTSLFLIKFEQWKPE